MVEPRGIDKPRFAGFGNLGLRPSVDNNP
jgi:hypothetical protein